MADRALSPVLALRHPPSAARAVPDAAHWRSTLPRRPRRSGKPAPLGRPLTARCLLVEAAGHPTWHGRGCRLGAIGPQRDDHAQRVAGPWDLTVVGEGHEPRLITLG